MILDLETPMNFQLKEEEKWLKLVHKQGNWALWFTDSFEVNFDI